MARQAVEQLQRYVADERLARQYPAVRFTGLAVVFHGWQLIHAESVSAPSPREALFADEHDEHDEHLRA